MQKKEFTKLIKIVFIFIIFFCLPYISSAATLGFSPSTVSRNIGDIFSVNVYVSSPNKSANAASGIVSFPQDKIEVISLSKSNSIVNLWVQEPSFSNTQGKVNFEGVILNPGYTGIQGNVITVVFRAKSAGLANISFSSGSILANDGSGADILDGMGTASFVVNSGINEKVIVPANNSNKNTPTISSITHSDQAKWYSNNTPEFSWTLPPNAIEVRTFIGKSANITPTVLYTSPISKKKVDTLPNGTYYFSLQIRNAEGWSDIARYRVNIDNKPPNPFSITFPHGAKGFEPRPVLIFSTTDDDSGISHYDIKVEGSSPIRVEPSEVSSPYTLTSQFPGTHTVIATAIDEAGNTVSASADFTIENIEAPTIKYYKEEIESGDIIKILGTTYKNSDITISIKQNNKILSEEYTKSNEFGDFVIVTTKLLPPGVYTFTARVIDTRGARSNETQPLNLIVNSPFLTKITDLALKYMSAIIFAILALGGIIGLGIFLWYRLFRVLRLLRREAREAEYILRKSFSILRKDIDEHIAKLKSMKSKRKLTTEEIAFLEHFEKNLDESENTITKEIKDISQ